MANNPCDNGSYIVEDGNSDGSLEFTEESKNDNPYLGTDGSTSFSKIKGDYDDNRW